MNIVFVSPDYYPTNGGVSHVMRYLAEGLVAIYDCKVSVLMKMTEGLIRETQYNGVDIYRYQVVYKSGLRPCGEIQEFQNKIREINPDVLIVEAAPTVTTELVLPMLSELKCVKFFHSHDFELLWFHIFQRRETLRDTIANPKNVLMWKWYFAKFFRKYASKFDALLYISPFCKDKELFDNLTNVPSYFLQNAVDEIFFDNQIGSECEIVLKKYCDIEKEEYLVDVSNYSACKRQITVMDEFYRCNHDEYALVFVGTNKCEYYDKLQKRKKKNDEQYGFREVHILLGVARTDIPKILEQGKLYLTASMHEAASVALLETMSVGTPFISSNVGNARILPGGVVVENVNEMHEMIDYLIENESEIDLLRRKGIIYTRETCQISSAVKTLYDLLVTFGKG